MKTLFPYRGGGASKSLIQVQHSNGLVTNYNPSASTDASRGDLLSSVMACVSSGDFVLVGAGNFLMHQLCNLWVSGVTYKFNSCYIYIDNTSAAPPGAEFPSGLFYSPVATTTNINVIGPLIIDGKSISGLYGNVHQGGSYRKQRDVTYQNWDQIGFWHVGGSDDGNENLNCVATGCGTGFNLGGEYTHNTDCIAQNNVTGIVCGGGNNRFSTCTARDNTTGFSLIHGNNDGHGVAQGCAFNHNTTNISVASDLANGFTFMGCHFYANQMDVNAPVAIVGGDVACNIIASAGAPTGIIVFDNIRWPQAARSTYLAGLSGIQLGKFVFRNNYGLTALEHDLILNTSPASNGTVSPVTSITRTNDQITAIS